MTATVEAAGEKISSFPRRRVPRSLMRSIGHYVLLMIGACIASVGLEIFLIPNEVIDGGVVGLSIMASYVTGINYGLLLVVFNLPFIYIGYRQIGRDFAVATGAAICFLAVWSSQFEPVPRLTDDIFLASVFGGIIDGIGVGIIMRAGGSLDGTEIVAIIADKRSVFSVGEVVMFINLFIFGIAGFLFDWERAMYSVVAYYVISKTIDVVIKGFNQSYSVMIVTKSPDEIGQAIMEEMGRGITVLFGEGGYKKEPRRVLYAVVTRLEVDKVKGIVNDIDDTAFVTINQVNDVVGGRFKSSGH